MICIPNMVAVRKVKLNPGSGLGLAQLPLLSKILRLSSMYQRNEDDQLCVGKDKNTFQHRATVINRMLKMLQSQYNSCSFSFLHLCRYISYDVIK